MKSYLKKRLAEETYSKEWLPPRSDIPRIEMIIKLVATEKRVLDIGCYDGTIGKLIAQNQNEVYGIDLSDQAVNLAKKKGIRAYQADIEENDLPFPKEFFDVIVAAEIIEHVFDTDGFLEKIREFLKPNGHLILTTPNLATLGRRLLLLFGKNPLIEVSCRKGAGGHIRYFVKKSLFDLIKSHGFKIEVFSSDVINFNNSGNLFITWPAKLFPTLGKSLIVKAVKR